MKATVGLVVAGACSAFAQTPIPISVSGNQARGTIALPGGFGAELTISFEDVVGLTPSALDVSASLVDPLDLALLGRLPGLGQVGVPGALPVLLRIEPSAASALSFAGVATVSLHTFNLELNPSVPLALFKSEAGGPFQDVTTSEGRGSYRVDGSTDGFCEFLVVVDTRPIDTIIVGKFDALQASLTQYSGSMSATVAGALQTQLTQARTQYTSGLTLGAIGTLTAFSDLVKAHSGTDIPDVWRAHDTERINVAGLLRCGADTLKFSLDRKASH